MKKKPPCPKWFTSLASELARRNAGKIDVSVAQTSEILGHLAEIIYEDLERTGWRPLWDRLGRLGKRRLAAAKRKK